jgi:hypothetical protein
LQSGPRSTICVAASWCTNFCTCREGAEKELTSCLESLQTSLGDTELSRELLDALAQWQATSEECSTLRQELREQVGMLEYM